MSYSPRTVSAWSEAPDPWVRRVVTLLALVTIGLAIYSGILFPTIQRWGATDAEVDCKLPGDELVNFPVRVSTRAITINAPVSDVWPWIAQIGQEHGGLYSYEFLENLVGCDITNADQIVPEWQNPQPGDLVRLGPEGYPYFTVVDVQPEESFVLRAGSGGSVPTSWTFSLEPIDANTTRLIVRTRSAGSWTRTEAFINDVVTPPLHFIMEREMLYGIARRAEALAAERVGAAA